MNQPITRDEAAFLVSVVLFSFGHWIGGVFCLLLAMIPVKEKQ